MEENEQHPSRVENIPTDSINPNPQNPRSLFDEIPMQELCNSIKEVGILVPLLVYERRKDSAFVILDGERRWRCAKRLSLKTVPANIIEEPDQISNIIRMFNIHNVREPWELMPTALKLEVIMRHIKSDREGELATITNLTRANVRRCKTLLSFPKVYQDMMMRPDPEARIKADFFIEMTPVLEILAEEYSVISNKYTRNEITDKFLVLYETQRLKNVLDFRKLRNLLTADVARENKPKIETLFLSFLEGRSDLNVFLDEANIATEKKSFGRVIKMFNNKLDNLKRDDVIKDKSLAKELEDIWTRLDQILHH